MQEIGLKAAGMINHPEGRNGKKFVPDSRNVMVATRMLTAGEFGVLRFVAPKEVGDYPYLCTFPGHWFQMNGTMHVVRDINSWSAETKP
jgi:azurin